MSIRMRSNKISSAKGRRSVTEHQKGSWSHHEVQQPGACLVKAASRARGSQRSAMGHPSLGCLPFFSPRKGTFLPGRASNCRICTSSTHSAGNHPVRPFTLPSQKPPSPMLSTVGKMGRGQESDPSRLSMGCSPLPGAHPRPPQTSHFPQPSHFSTHGPVNYGSKLYEFSPLWKSASISVCIFVSYPLSQVLLYCPALAP